MLLCVSDQASGSSASDIDTQNVCIRRGMAEGKQMIKVRVTKVWILDKTPIFSGSDLNPNCVCGSIAVIEQRVKSLVDI